MVTAAEDVRLDCIRIACGDDSIRVIYEVETDRLSQVLGVVAKMTMRRSLAES